MNRHLSFKVSILGILMMVLVSMLQFVWANVESDRQAAEREREEMRQRLVELQKKINTNAAQQSEIQKKVRASDEQISDISQKILKANQLLTKAQGQMIALEKEQKNLEKDLEGQQEKLAEILRRQYQSGTASRWRTVLSGDNIQQMHQNMHYLSYVAQQQNAQIQVVKTGVKRLESLKERQREQEASIKIQIQQQAELQKSLQEAKSSQQNLLATLEQSRKYDTQQAEVAKENEEQLSRLVNQLQIVLKQKQQDEVNRPTVVTIPGSPPQNSVKWSDIRGKNFSQLKGRLIAPASGKVADVFGRKKSGGDLWEGVFIQAQEGDPVLSLADGTIVFSDWYNGFGNLIIVDHGAGYLSVYGYNQSLLKAVGESVQAGDKIALVGRSGGQKLAALYLEIRFNGKPVNPFAWLKT